MNSVKEIFRFVLSRKKYFLLPVIFALLLIGGITVVGQGSIIAPFVYSIF